MLRILVTLVMICSCQFGVIAQPTATIPPNPIPGASAVSIDAMTSYLRQNFNSDTARIRAIYNWVTTHISYDVSRFLARDKYANIPPPTAIEVLQSRMAVCQGYSDLFIALCKGVGIEAMRIGGYSKQMGKVSEIAHAWVAAKLDGEWYLFDPTWGAGSVRNDVFMKRYTERFYKVAPAKFIEDHMPTDPMFQFLSNPVSHPEFREGKPPTSKTVFNYNDSIKVYNNLAPVAQAAAELRRIEAGGVSNNLLQERVVYLKNILNASASKDAFMEAQGAYKQSFTLYRAFIDQKNKRFANSTDAEVRSTVDSIEFYIRKARSLLQETNPKTDAQRDSKANFTGALDKFWTEIIMQKDFAMKWIATDKEKRKMLFMR